MENEQYRLGKVNSHNLLKYLVDLHSTEEKLSNEKS